MTSGLAQDGVVHIHRAAARHGARRRLMIAVSWTFLRSTPRRIDALVPAVAAHLRRTLQSRSRRQRRAENGGHHLAAPDHGRSLHNEAHVPFWVIIACYITIGLGTLFGGWRIVKTMGQRITKLKPVGGFCAETGGAITLFLATASASRSRRPTRSRARSSAWAQHAMSRRCDGVSPAGSCGRGFSRYRAREQ